LYGYRNSLRDEIGPLKAEIEEKQKEIEGVRK
jgi:hypothetical protein